MSASHVVSKLADVVNRAANRGGRIIVPAFAVGRAQQLVLMLHELANANRIPNIPIFVDSPLAINVTKVHRDHPECFDAETLQYLTNHEDPFGFKRLQYIREAADSKKLNDLHGPFVVISASGMCEAGRIRHHLQNNIGDPKNLVLFIGYCAEHTLGAQILAHQNPVNIFGQPNVVRAKIASIDAFSGHADKNELRRYVEAITGDIKKISVIHGEESQALAFAETLRGMKPRANVIVPEYKQVVDI